MTNSAPEKELNEVEYIYLGELSEPRDHSLRIVLEEAAVNRSGVVDLKLPGLATISKNAWPIEPLPGCRTFELYWERYVAYLVTEEVVGSMAPLGSGEECYTGRIFRLYSKSHFLPRP